MGLGCFTTVIAVLTTQFKLPHVRDMVVLGFLSHNHPAALKWTEPPMGHSAGV